MSSRWANPINNNILRDLEGTVLAGGSLEFYEAGTSTPLSVYSDSALAVDAGSTLTADAFGLISDFHMAAGTQYKMVAKDSGGTTKWTRDDVFSLDTAVDTRLDSLEASVAAISSGKNAIRNSSCQKQRTDSNGLTVTAPSISSAFQLGTVAGHYVKSTNVTAGTITRGTSTGLTAGYYVHASGVSNNNSAATVVAQFRVDPGDAGQFVNTSGVFSCQVYHDVGSAVDYTITVKKADAEDDYSSLTTISTSGTTSVNSGTWTGLEFSVSAMGDCRNGVVIEVSAACGVQTTKNYYFGMPQFETGTSATAWTSTPAENDRAGLEYKPRQYAAEFINSTCRISQDTDTDHDILVPSGSGARDSTDAFDIITSADITKQIDNAASPPASTGWQEGDNENGFPSGVNSGVPAASTWYYFFLIAKTDGTVDAGFDDNASATNLLADASTYTYYRHIGSVRTDASANITQVMSNADIGKKPFVQVFTANGTFNWPPLVQGIKVTAIGGGGGGGARDGGTATDGSVGGDSEYTYNSVTATASGGDGGQRGDDTADTSNTGPAGTYDIGMPGAIGLDRSNPEVFGGNSAWGWGHGSTRAGIVGGGYGGGGRGGTGGTNDGQGGHGGSGVISYLSYVSGQDTMSVTVGSGGSGGLNGGTTTDGAPGIVVVEW